jgi:hypothetical protein
MTLAAPSVRCATISSSAPVEPVRRAIIIAIAAPFVVALVAPAYWEVGLRLGFGALGAVAAWGLSRRVWTVADVPPELAPRRQAPTVEYWPAAADRLRHSLELAIPRGQPDRVDRARGLRRACRSIAAERLQAHHGIDLERDDHREAARAALGADVHEFLEGGPMIDHEHLVDALERL